MAAASGLLLLGCLSVAVPPAKAWLLVPLEILFWPLLIVNIVLVVWAAARRSRAILIPLVAVIPALFFTGRYIRFSGGDGPSEGSNTLKVVTYNVGRFHSGKNLEGKSDRDSIMRYLAGTDADIVCLQEVWLSERDFAATLSGLMKGYTATYYLYTGKKGRFGNVILSRKAPLRKGHIEFDSSRNLAVWADFKAGGETIRVYDCHLESYAISPAGIAKALLEKKDREVLEDTGRKMRGSIRKRATQVEQMFREIEESPVGTLVCGDFNDTPLSWTYHKMSHGHRDSFTEAGRGIGGSFPAAFPLTRLDYMFAPESMKAVSYSSPSLGYSDHRPVTCEFEIH